MARKVYIDVIVDDKGTTKRLAVDAKKLEASLEKTGKGAQQADRNIKGVAQVSANATKNFSKMQQGISGGLVPAYATLAAQAFALSAAFNFVQSAADFKNLTEGQAQFGAVTGVAYSRITKSLQEATAGQLKYAEAAQATAIGTAAGLTGNQLEGLATAAKNVSFALGRDLTDSFNRLIRGVTKAEPELLDELGIILRLEPATQQYAASIGKTAQELNAFERSQAVANFVLDEAETKFGKIAKIIDEDAFAVQQFGKAFDDIVNQIKVGVVSVLGPVLTFLSTNISSLVAALTLFALPITKAIIPGLGNMSEAAQEAASAAKKSLDTANEALVDSSRALKIYTNTQDEAVKKANELAKAGGLTPAGQRTDSRLGVDFLSGASSTAASQKNADRILKAAEKQIDQSGKVTTGKLKGYNAQQVADLRKSYELRSQIVKGFEKRTLLSFQGIAAGAKVASAQINVTWKKAFSGILGLGTLAAKGLDLVFKGVGLLGIALLLFDIGKAAYEAFFPISEEAKRAKKELEDLNSRLVETYNHLDKTVKLRADLSLLSLNERVVQLGNAIQSADIGQIVKDIEKLSTLKEGSAEFETLRQNLLKTTGALSQLDPAYKILNESVKEGAVLTKGQTRTLLNYSSQLISSSMAAQQLGQSTKDITNEINNLANTVSRAPLQTLREALTRDLDLRAEVELTAGRDFENQKAAIEAKIDDLSNSALGRFAIVSDEDKKEIAALKKTLADLTANRERQLEIAKQNAQILEETEALALAQNAIQLQQVYNAERISNINQASRTFDAQRARLKESEIGAENAILSARNDVLSAEGRLIAAKVRANGELTTEVSNAQQALTIAETTLRTAENRRDREREVNEERRAGINAAERQLELQRKINAAATQTALASQRVAAIRSGLLGQNLSTIGVSRATRGAERSQLEGQQQGLLRQLAAAEQARRDLTENASEQERDAAVQRLVNLGLEIAKVEQLLDLNKQREAIAVAAISRETEDLRLKRETLSINPIQQAYQQKLLERGKEANELTDKQKKAVFEQVEAQFFLNEAISAQESIYNAVSSNLQDGLNGIITGTMSVKQAFASMATGILQELAKVLTQMLVTRAILAAFPGFAGFSGGGIATPPMARYGGVMQGYATGGIARGRNAGYPAILHGTEAVVPLPNGNSIPVEMRNGGAVGTNNVTVNVSVDQNGNAQSNTQMDNQQAGALGKAISAAVQEELQRQKRPGGMLSPYGAA